MAWYVGLMSGTSLDGVDAVLARDDPAAGVVLQSVGHVGLPMPETLRAELLALNTSPQSAARTPL